MSSAVVRLWEGEATVAAFRLLSSAMAQPFEISHRFVDDWAALHPTDATIYGVAGHDHRWTDYSPEGAAARAELMRRYRAEIAPHLDHPDRMQWLAARVLDEYLARQQTWYEHREHLRDLNHLDSPLQDMRTALEMLDLTTSEGRQALRERLAGVEAALGSYQATLEEGRRQGLVAARRQVESVVAQAQALAGQESMLVRFAREEPSLEREAAAAGDAFAAFADYLRNSYLPSAAEEDAVGEERYLRMVRRFLGAGIDPEATYRWGWEEIHRIRAEMSLLADEILPGGSMPEVVELLDTDPTRAAPSPEAFLEFVAERQRRAVEDLSGRHFEVAPEIREVAVRLDPPGSALGAHYTGPAEDFSRPGIIWYSLGDTTRIPLWQEVSTAYHEGFPGHHLQVGTALLLSDRLSRAHRLLVWYSGSGEGWALYAERLMDELGYFEKPEYRFGMLASELFRACRVVVDIGSHLRYRIPEHSPVAPGGEWSYEVAVAMMRDVGLQPDANARSEVTRYLGWPGQAISYKVGQQAILELREEWTRRLGDRFDLAAFHRSLLEAGGIGLDLLRRATAVKLE